MSPLQHLDKPAFSGLFLHLFTLYKFCKATLFDELLLAKHDIANIIILCCKKTPFNIF